LQFQIDADISCGSIGENRALSLDERAKIIECSRPQTRSAASPSSLRPAARLKNGSSAEREPGHLVADRQRFGVAKRRAVLGP
jgi:hypothetical protein